ncbi:MAG: NADH-quinone oxidoreductase subunit N [Vampirovibrionales bacterium]|nr:NADH-quinone oxidoreductase subunit N [Vampirovibrionales bacterium]
MTLFSSLMPTAAMQWIADQNVNLIAPEVTLLLGILWLFISSLTANKSNRHLPFWVSLMALVLACGSLVYLFKAVYWPHSVVGQATWLSSPILFGALQADLFGLIVRGLLLLGGFLLILMSRQFATQIKGVLPAEFYIALLSALLGGLFLASASDLITVFVALETLGISSYILVSSLRGNIWSAEAGLKYLVYGGVSSACLLMGFALLYGLSGGHTDFAHISVTLQQVVQNPAAYGLLLAFAATLIIAGLGFKLSAAPFHMWTPDVYEGAPLPVTAFLSVLSKTAAFALTVRLLSGVMMPLHGTLLPALIAIAVLSMTVGNVLALVQTSIKRLLAYSTIAHAGYMILAVIVASQASLGSLLFYLGVYLFMNLGAFASAMLLSSWMGSEKISDFAGLFTKRPGLVFMFSLALLSLAGIPVTAGFFAKFYLFKSVAEAGSQYFWLLAVALLNSTISLYYYINVIRVMVIAEPSAVVNALPTSDVNGSSLSLNWVLQVSTIATLLLGFVSAPAYELMLQASRSVIPFSPSISSQGLRSKRRLSPVSRVAPSSTQVQVTKTQAQHPRISG